MSDKWIKARVRRHMRDEWDFVDAYTWRGVFAAYKNQFGWRAMHIPSGLSIEGYRVNLKTLKRAKEYIVRAHALLPHDQWLLERPGLGAPGVSEAVQALMHEFR
jgi:hypothetical protein